MGTAFRPQHVRPSSRQRRIEEKMFSRAHRWSVPPLLTVGQMVEKDSPVPSYPADVVKMRNGWIKTLQAPPDTKAESTRSIVRRHVLCVAHSIVEEMFSVPDNGRKGADSSLHFEKGKVIYSQPVKLPSPITDYLTWYVDKLWGFPPA